MATSISVKNVPDRIAAKLRERAARHHRSLQGEVLSILEASVTPQRLSVAELRAEIDALALATPDEAVTMVRELRDGRQGHGQGS
jgi:plasmid stability protein